MNAGTDLLDQLKTTPHWMLVLIGLTIFGVYWKRSQWPNRYLKFVNLILPTIAYPILHYGPDAEHSYWNPIATLALHGFAIGIASEFVHEGIITKIKNVFPGFKFPDDNPPIDYRNLPNIDPTQTP